MIFAISDYGSAALLLTASKITYLDLPQLAPQTLRRMAAAFHDALATAVQSEDAARRREAQTVLTTTLEWLWDAAACPVLDGLGYRRTVEEEAQWPRAWWVPSGPLTLLPLHAAGYHGDSADDPHRRTVMDRVVSSYTPTVRALRYARERAESLAAEPPVTAQSLIVAMSTTPGLPGHGRLGFVEAEAAMLQTRLPSPVLLREPDPANRSAGPNAPKPTKANVLKRLPECAIAHFACHGASDPADPSKSRLLLHDHADTP